MRPDPPAGGGAGCPSPVKLSSVGKAWKMTSKTSRRLLPNPARRTNSCASAKEDPELMASAVIAETYSWWSQLRSNPFVH